VSRESYGWFVERFNAVCVVSVHYGTCPEPKRKMTCAPLAADRYINRDVESSTHLASLIRGIASPNLFCSATSGYLLLPTGGHGICPPDRFSRQGHSG
jgi:hypothetical protein